MHDPLTESSQYQNAGVHAFIAVQMSSVLGDAVSRKRSLFKKPAWSKPQSAMNDDEIFHRSSRTYVNVDEEERRHEAQVSITQNKDDSQWESRFTEHSAKRRRLPDVADHDPAQRDLDVGAPLNHVQADDTTHDTECVEISPEAALRRSISLSGALSEHDDVSGAVDERSQSTDSQLKAIVLAERKDTNKKIEERAVLPVKTVQPHYVDGQGLSDSDEEFRELACKARARAIKKRLPADDLSGNIALVKKDDNITKAADLSLEPKRKPMLSEPPEPIVQILITSRIPGTGPLIVNRRISQRLKEVRLLWCQKQGLCPQEITQVFLSWRGRRLFDVTSCRSLGIGLDLDGNIVERGEKDTLGEENRQIHMEATNQELLDKARQAMEQEVLEVSENEILSTVATAQQPSDERIRIILKTKGYGDSKLIVKPVRFLILSRSIKALTSPFRVRRFRKL